MKKILLVALLVLLPMSVYALEPMADCNLDEITAQEGVKITIAGSGDASQFGMGTEALEIRQKAVSTAWTNKENGVESGIVNKLTQTIADTIFVTGDLTIVASTDGDVSSVAIGLPEVGISKGSKKTEIYITSRDTNLGDSNFISQVTADPASGKLGTQYTDAGFTHIQAGGSVTISAIP
ncbi:DUF6160 family protein [Desulfoluna butyratoxydans]|uniref:DUF6160 domain-containing protein n=1 Tax=Desulfoluna butyratoxydans TaxID=231438 RepID=A0A4U8YMF5_9BACT|nr:DUF6160 family protein [Desulfoluna butyratoxydans]VFQ45236.1 hypothetical protein MSL71_28930 [Desulfoluna butyratoxydans]